MPPWRRAAGKKHLTWEGKPLTMFKERSKTMRRTKTLAVMLVVIGVTLFASEVFARARYFHPVQGRFTQRDPAGYVDGMSLYEYVRSCSTGNRDPSGGWKFRAKEGILIVEAGDTLWGIARDLTGKGSNYRFILPGVDPAIRPGDELELANVPIYLAWARKKWEAHVVDMTWKEFVAVTTVAAFPRWRKCATWPQLIPIAKPRVKKYAICRPCPCYCMAIIWKESKGDPDAYRYEPAFHTRYLKGKEPWKSMPWYDSPKRISASYGPMQIMYPVAYERGYRATPEGLYGQTGFVWGMKQLEWLLARHKTWKMAVTRYCGAGPRAKAYYKDWQKEVAICGKHWGNN